MSTMQAEVFEAFRAIDIPEDKARGTGPGGQGPGDRARGTGPGGQGNEAATALGQRDTEVSSLKSDMVVMKWMMGFVLAFQVAIFAKLFVH